MRWDFAFENGLGLVDDDLELGQMLFDPSFEVRGFMLDKLYDLHENGPIERFVVLQSIEFGELLRGGKGRFPVSRRLAPIEDIEHLDDEKLLANVLRTARYSMSFGRFRDHLGNLQFRVDSEFVIPKTGEFGYRLGPLVPELGYVPIDDPLHLPLGGHEPDFVVVGEFVGRVFARFVDGFLGGVFLFVFRPDMIDETRAGYAVLLRDACLRSAAFQVVFDMESFGMVAYKTCHVVQYATRRRG